MRKLSQRQIVFNKISKHSKNDVDSFVKKMKETVKKDPIMIEKFKEYGVPLDDIDSVCVAFCPLDVSAKTKNKKIYINEDMLADDSSVKDPTHYLIHELVHYLQQKTGKNLQKHKKEEEYLDKETEQEAFEAQIDFKKRKESPEEAEDYVDRLLDHHDIKGKERKEKKEELLEGEK
jgi:hypothetical protein